MQDADKQVFLRTLGRVLSFYKQEANEFVTGVWWESLRPYDLAAVQEAFNRHAVNPDVGQFAPKPADIVRMIGGTSTDAAMMAWSKVEKAVRSIGQYQSVIFDDPLIHRVVEDMGGWVKMCNCPSENDFVFVGKEFQTRYRGFAMRNERPEYPAALIGHAEASNVTTGQIQRRQYRMLGDPERCKLVYKHGMAGGALPIAMLEASTMLPQLPGPNHG